MHKKEGHDFWQDHSTKFLEMALRTDRMETLACPDGHGKKTGTCGDTVEFFLLTDADGTIRRASFQVQGCLNTVACANTVCELVEGKTLDAAWDLTPEQVIEYLESLPEHEHHCAELAVGALYLSIADAQRKRREPWKKIYGSRAEIH
ncbi:iron-sulfur cluster assembly scaffold protein [Desulfosoma caldarium]|uniref:Nitrogen fixation NifU-like protein n=1 Tax=Desulfosoma caldarium TaxID=610254 RepID=A0A3N1VEZ7_9BACT|nr:iron-sulfur cluster assembly scaffold protein [Desulfosoma caldarium]ROR01455.1 nitrogen fixation NifU-like protein [Desulfosoma caldarium]